MSQPEQYLVTGGAGFIGSHIAHALAAQKKKVRVFDNLSTGRLEHLESVREKIEFVRGDLKDRPAVLSAVDGITHIFHVAAIRAVARSVDDPQETNEVNVGGTLNLLMAARTHKVRRLVYSSSSSVYGDGAKFPLAEDDRPDPLSPYAASKLMGEYYCRIFNNLYGLETVSLRYFNVFGPRQNPESRYSAVIPIFVDSLLKGESPVIEWDGRQSRDFTYVDNVVHGNLLAMECQSTGGEVLNVACQEEFSVLEVFESIRRILKCPAIEPRFAPKRTGDVRRTYADISKAKRHLGFKVQTRFHKGLEKTVNWFRAVKPVGQAAP